MDHFILECSLSEPFSKETEKESAQAIDRFLQEQGGRWIRSAYNEDRTRLICEFEAPDEGTVRRAWELAQCPVERLWRAVVYQRDALLVGQE